MTQTQTVTFRWLTPSHQTLRGTDEHGRDVAEVYYVRSENVWSVFSPHSLFEDAEFSTWKDAQAYAETALSPHDPTEDMPNPFSPDPEPQTIADVSWDDGDAPMVRAPKGTGYAYCTQAEYDRLTTPEPHEDDTQRPRWLARLNTASVAALFLALTITPAHAAPTTLPAGCTITHEWEDQSKLADCAGTQWAYDPDGLGPYCEKTSKRFGDSGWHTVKATKQAQKDCTREIQQARNR